MIVPTQAGVTPSIAPSLSAGSEILSFFRELKAFIEIPVIQDIIRQRMGIAPNNGGQVQLPHREEPMQLKKYNSEGQEVSRNITPIKKEVVNPETYVLNQLATPEGRKSLSDGIGQVKDLLGDIKLSELQSELTKGDIKK